MKYLAKNPLLLFYLKTFDAILPKSTETTLYKPKKILLSNLAHMGDLVVATSILPPLRKLYPEAEIGFLLGSWSKDVVDGHPLVSKIHIADHWKHNRSHIPLWKKVSRYLETREKAIQEIQEERYDWAIDLYPYFPNAIPLMWRAEIPCRIGYTSGGFGPLLTHPKLWEDKDQSMARYHCDLLGIEEEVLPSLEYEEISEAVGDFAIIHIGTGAKAKEWSLHKWKKVLEYFAQKNYPVFLTGKGPREQRQIDRLIAEASHGTSLCSALTWKQLVFLVQKAKLVVSVETAILHVASFAKTPNIVVSPGIQRVWRPENPACRVIESHASVEVVIQQIEEVIAS